MSQRLDLSGKYNSLTVIRFSSVKNQESYFLCACDCGKEKEISGQNIKSGGSKTCGGCRKTVVGHNMPTVYSWRGMRKRCNDKNNVEFKNYGGRGISVCDRWINSFENFLEDMGPKPAGKSIDRVDNNGNYSPENCWWANPSDQSRNKRSNIYIEINNENKIMKDWSLETGIPYSTLRHKLKRLGINKIKEIITNAIKK